MEGTLVPESAADSPLSFELSIGMNFYLFALLVYSFVNPSLFEVDYLM